MISRCLALLFGVALLMAGGQALGNTSPGKAAVGAVEGVVRLESVPPESPPMLSPYARRRYRPPPTTARSQITPENVVIYVLAEGASGGSSPSSPASTGSTPPGASASTSGDRQAAVITQRDRTIIPHVTAIRVGTRIDFPNEDDVFHNLFSLSDPRPFNLGRYPPGESRSVTFDRPGVVRMFCDIHSEMTAVIRVLDTPWFTRPDPDGGFRIPSVPEGRRTVVAWHDQLGADTVQVEVSTGSDARVDFQLPR
ncbi:MAG: carboxypeptidase regulatory-like domain-containing protein [Longimicrobiales bacterium]|nr:carboxypeptidase regulatory-like domain-containing protein [Longimicrobiales bacterium]